MQLKVNASIAKVIKTLCENIFIQPETYSNNNNTTSN